MVKIQFLQGQAYKREQNAQGCEDHGTDVKSSFLEFQPDALLFFRRKSTQHSDLSNFHGHLQNVKEFICHLSKEHYLFFKI